MLGIAPDHRWNGGPGGRRAYCRSKLGNIWIAAELTRRFPELCVFVAHPGVVATNLGGNAGSLGDRIKARFMIPTIAHGLPLVREFGFCGCASGQGIAKLDH